MDDLQIEAMLHELSPLAGCAVGKIHQPADDLVVMRLWTGGRNLRLLLALGQNPKLHLSERTFANPFHPPGFCRLLRARIARIQGFARAGRERIVRIDCAGPKGDVRLYCELFGPVGNLVLADAEDRIIDALKRQRKGTENRLLLPGRPYHLPNARQMISLFERLPEIPASCRDADSFRNWLTTTLWPMSGAQAAVMAAEVEAGQTAQEVLETFRRQLLAGQFHPVRMMADGRERIVVLPPAAKRDKKARSLSHLLDEKSSPPNGTEPVEDARREIDRALRKQEKKLRRRLVRIEAEKIQKEGHVLVRQQGELLLAQLHRVKKGMTSVRLTDYYRQPPGPVAIPLDPSLTPQQNAEKYFRLARKYQLSLEHIERRQRETLDELDWLEEIRLYFEQAATPADLTEIRAELLAAGLLAASCREPASRRRPTGTPALNRAKTPSGFTLLWGRSSRGNDALTTRIAAPHDFWFHAKGVPGCHLVLRRDSRDIDVPKADLEYAAAVAAGWSRARDEKSVEVMCALTRDIGKTKGARPGQVTVRRFRTLRVSPLRLQPEATTLEND
ncbi:putative ribosome quality control (RQC) complex YloA/Tae2 family protein [Geothermobacter ehrlichii]|uniref:Putative ribosome quality control (RQC) complex YloA/Tae2 family protein n=1 Tax=Geothermobacter ehrlichii TaxID=213224 RepID=A0A5D3WP86_9BACT|nr:NFACT family protein [Geothermobacter ehrlichii]TYP00154.1 putative ribosome quality control (RQC) complex YloA/Tae2 family protein [Geothermobacter ehrlichii]